MFDFNNDGEMNFIERAVEFNFLQYMIDEDEREEKITELEVEGLDVDDLSMMNDFERAEAIEAAGLDSDNYNFD